MVSGFVSVVELARRQTRAAGQADPVGQYFTALNKGDTRTLETAWPSEVVVYDPRAGEIRGHRQLRQFVSRDLSWLAGLQARTETVACAVVGGRAVVELLAHLDHDGRELAWPVAVVAESPNDLSVVCCTCCSQWPVDERRHLRPPILKPGHAQAGLGVYERGPHGLLAAALVYDDVEPPVGTCEAAGSDHGCQAAGAWSLPAGSGLVPAGSNVAQISSPACTEVRE